MLPKPHLIDFPRLGDDGIGFLTVAEAPNVPFEVQRVYWTYNTPADMVRGHHAHHDLEQLIFAVAGQIEFELEDVAGNKQTFLLNSPAQGLYIPRLYWRKIQFSEGAVLLCLASRAYDEADYIREYSSFKDLKDEIQK